MNAPNPTKPTGTAGNGAAIFTSFLAGRISADEILERAKAAKIKLRAGQIYDYRSGRFVPSYEIATVFATMFGMRPLDVFEALAKKSAERIDDERAALIARETGIHPLPPATKRRGR